LNAVPAWRTVLVHMTRQAGPQPHSNGQQQPGGSPVLSLERVHVLFGGLHAVRGVSFDLRGGDLLGLIGPNGAGKTTLLRVAAGIQPPSAGAVRVIGEDLVPGATDAYRQVGFTPDTPAVYEQLTVREFLRFVAKGYDLTAAEVDERIDFWLEKVWLTEKANQRIKSLSRGMRQRIGIARTMLPSPAAVLLDEPAAGLDPAGRVQFRQLLCDLRAQGKALVVSSHILSDMAEYCTHIGIMAGGAMLQFGTVREIAAASGDGRRCRYTVLLAEPAPPRTAEWLEQVAGVARVQVDGDRITLEYPSGRAEAAGLLAQLVEKRFAVASFTANAPGLEEAYLRTGIRQVD
jgi:ABC-2 type transport system ATP-binding protein